MGIIKSELMKLPDKIISLDIKRKMLNCNIHGDYEAYVTNNHYSVCPDCVEEELQNERRARNEELRRNQVKAKAISIMKKSAVPPLFRDVSFDDFVITCKEAEKVIVTLKQYVDARTRVLEGGKSILLHGGYRTGKSMLGVSVINEMMNAGNTAMYIKSSDMIEYVKRTWRPGYEISQDEQMDKFVEFDFLCVDNFPWGINSEKERQIFTAIIDRRVENLRPTITTSRMSPKEIEKKFHAELSERLTFRGAAIHFSWEKYKTQGLF